MQCERHEDEADHPERMGHRPAEVSEGGGYHTRVSHVTIPPRTESGVCREGDTCADKGEGAGPETRERGHA